MNPLAANDYLPQKAPFQMIDFLTGAEENFFQSTFTIRENNVMVHDNIFTEGGMIENMAQTAAAGTGYFYTNQGKEVPVGYIGAVKNIHIIDQASVGNHLTTEVSIKMNIGNASIAEGKIFMGEKLLASCELTIFVNN